VAASQTLVTRVKRSENVKRKHALGGAQERNMLLIMLLPVAIQLQAEGTDRPIVIEQRDEVVVREFDIKENRLREVFSLDIPGGRKPIDVRSSKTVFALIYREGSASWSVEIRSRSDGQIRGVVTGSLQVAVSFPTEDWIHILTDGEVALPASIKQATVSRLGPSVSSSERARLQTVISKLEKHFSPPIALHSLDGYLVTRMYPLTGTSQGTLLNERIAIVARHLPSGADRYSLVEIESGHVLADFGLEFIWSNVFAVGGMVVFSPIEKKHKVTVYDQAGNLLFSLDNVLIG
jgi:hypothetical protein